MTTLSCSCHCDRFILKGAFLYAAWGGFDARPTRDLDLMTFGDPSITDLEAVFREVCSVEVEPDGVQLLADTIRGRAIREEAPYDGVRLTMTGSIGSARIRLQVDVGFGDAIVPRPTVLDFPSLLNYPRPSLLSYRPEVVIAEKLHAMVSLGLVNSRLKDYFDIWWLATTSHFDGADLVAAVRATFQRRTTEIPASTFDGLSPRYAERWQPQWRSLERRFEVEGQIPDLQGVIDTIQSLLLPVLRVAVADDQGQASILTWVPGRGWTEEGS